MSGAWAKGASSAVASAPPAGRLDGSGEQRGGGGGGQNRRSNQNNRRSGAAGGRDAGGGGQNNRRGSQTSQEGRGTGRGGRDGGGRGRGGGGRNNNANQNANNSKSIRIIHKDVQLLDDNGVGSTREQQSVRRIPAREFMRLRLEYLEISESIPFTPHETCRWTDVNRIEEIQYSAMRAIELGDVSRNRPETAPALEDVAPLEVNEETRWKSKAMKTKSAILDDKDIPPPETTEEILAKTRLILNKISWTTLDRLTDQLVEISQLETNAEVMAAVIHLLIQKSQMEHHFGPMYAQLCARIAKQHKPFKKELLSQCQKEFEIDTAHKIAQATEGVTDKEEIEYHSMLIRKHYVGHIKFLGELYMRDVVKLAIMTYCLDELLKDTEHEENLECFAHLMTTMGEKLDVHAKQNNKPFDWDKVFELRESPSISNRIKFLLQDLLELKNRGWVSRRKKESAVNLHELHKEIAKEEEAAAKASKTGRRSSTSSMKSSGSSNNLRRSSSVSSVPTIDDDGFVEISRSSMKKISSKTKLEEDSNTPSIPEGSSVGRTEGKDSSAKASVSVLSPDECSGKAKNLLKEFFVGGDLADAVLTLDEIIQVNASEAVERGIKAIEGSMFLVMEMKRAEAEKCATVLCRAYTEGKLPAKSILMGLMDPMEYLSDIEIDAPLAGSHLSHIVSELIKVDALKLDYLMAEAPAYFKTDGKPAIFCARVLKGQGREVSDADLELIASVMTADDKDKYPSAKALFDSV